MDGFFEFLANNYLIFMGIAGVLLIALVGFFVDGKKKKNKLEEVPASTTTVNQATSAAETPVVPEVPAQPSEPEPSLVFEQPSLNENETMKEISGSGAEPSLTFEQPSVEESAPVDFNGGPAIDDLAEVGTIGEPIVAPDMTTDTVTTNFNDVTPEVPAAPMPEAPVEAAPQVPSDTTPIV